MRGGAMKKIFHPLTVLFFLAGLVILLLGLALAGQSFILNAIVIPAEYFSWLAGLALKAIPEDIYWGVLIILCLIFVLRSLVSSSGQIAGERKTSQSINRSERVAFWGVQVRLLQKGGYSRLRFAEFFGKLILDILTYSGQIEPDFDAASEKSLDEGLVEVPTELREFLKIRMAPLASIQRPNFSDRLRKTVGSWQQGLTAWIHRKESREKEVKIDPGLLVSVGYLEHELEVDNNQNGN